MSSRSSGAVSPVSYTHLDVYKRQIVIVAPPITNPVFFPSNWFYAYADSLYSIEREGVAIADVTSVYQYMLTNKRYIDMSGDLSLIHILYLWRKR